MHSESANLEIGAFPFLQSMTLIMAVFSADVLNVVFLSVSQQKREEDVAIITNFWLIALAKIS